jgi:hypothetical protein
MKENDSNFREIRTASIKSGILYQNRHPIPSPDGQDKNIAKLVVNAGIAAVLNLDSN